jgi:hypothetical protein
MKGQVITGGGADVFDRVVRQADKQARFAMAVALTRTAYDIRAAERKEMAAAFDRPTPFTLNAVTVQPATVQRLVAEIAIRTEDNDPRARYLSPEIYGGRRLHKRFEGLLISAGIMNRGEYAVPSAAVQLNSYGNIPLGKIMKVISQLKAWTLAGFDANATNSKRSRARRQKERYFVARQGYYQQGRRSWKNGEKRQHLPDGIYVDMADGKGEGRNMRPFILFVKRPQYRPRLRWEEVAAQVYRQNFGAHFRKAYANALATARPVR